MPKIAEMELINFENDFSTLNKLIQELSQLKETSRQLVELEQKLKLEQHAELQRCEELTDELEKCIAANLDRQENEDVEESLNIDAEKFTTHSAGKLENHSYLLGYRVTDLELTALNTQLVTFEEGEKFDLIQIYPKHPNFDAIKRMLYETNDISGLLATLRKYFDMIIKTQLEESKICVKQEV